jgi:hypothetical protein
MPLRVSNGMPRYFIKGFGRLNVMCFSGSIHDLDVKLFFDKAEGELYGP